MFTGTYNLNCSYVHRTKLWIVNYVNADVYMTGCMMRLKISNVF